MHRNYSARPHNHLHLYAIMHIFTCAINTFILELFLYPLSCQYALSSALSKYDQTRTRIGQSAPRACAAAAAARLPRKTFGVAKPETLSRSQGTSILLSSLSLQLSSLLIKRININYIVMIISIHHYRNFIVIIILKAIALLRRVPLVIDTEMEQSTLKIKI